MNQKLLSTLMLLLTALIWGAAFVAQSVGMDHLGPFTFNCLRSVIGGLALLPLVMYARKKTPAPAPDRKKNTWVGGVACGVILFAASAFQQFGIQEDTSAGKAGFITALYIVLVPLFGLVFGRKASPIVWAAVLLSTLGLYRLCIPAGAQGLSIQLGDLLILVCAFLFTAHILVIDHFSPRADCIQMSCIQFFVAALLSLVCTLLFESPTLPALRAAWLPVLYAGLLSSGVGYTLQIIAQRNTHPTVASLILSLESVFAALAGFLLLGESFTLRELSGMLLMFIAIILAQIPARRPGRRSLPS